MEVFAAFVFAPAVGGGWAATTRAADRGEAGRVGLPGGKVEAGEWPAAAALREAREEGWAIDAHPFDLHFVHRAVVDGRPVEWYWLVGGAARPLSEYKERGRIAPVRASLAELARTGYGNDAAVAALLRRLGMEVDPYPIPR